MSGAAVMQQALLGRVVTHFTGRSHLTDERDAQYIGNRMGPYLKRYRADVIGARKYAKQKRQRLLLKQDVSALPHCAANGDGDTAVRSLSKSLCILARMAQRHQ